MNLKKRKKKKIINKLVIIIILLIISISHVLKIFNDKMLPQIINYSEVETKKIVSTIINSTIIEQIAKNTTMDDLFITLKDSSGNIKSIDINSSEANKLLVDATTLVEQNLKYLENGEIEKLNLSSNILSSHDPLKLKKGIIYEVPSGVILNNVLLNNLFPKIPVKMDLIGDIFCKLNTQIESYGINNALLKVNINIEAEVKILLPFVSQNTKISTDIPIVMKIIEGNVPNYYYDGYLNIPYVTNNVKQ